MTDIATSISVLPALANGQQTGQQAGLQDPQNRVGATESAGRSPETGEQTVDAVAGTADKPALDSSADERKSSPQDGRGERVDITV